MRRGRGVGHRPVLRPCRESVRQARAIPAPTPRAGNVNTIDEVPDSSWFTNRILARPVSLEEASRGPLNGERPGGRHLVGDPAQKAGIRARASRCATPRGSVVRLVRREGLSRSRDRRDSRREQDLLDARATGRSRTSSSASGWISSSSARTAKVARPRRERAGRCGRATSRTCLEAVAAQRRRLVSRRRGAGRARAAARRIQILRHAARRPERRRAARAPARTARAQGLRRVDEPHRHEGGQHARHADHRRTGAGIVRHYLQDVGRRSAPGPTRRTTTTRAGKQLFEGDSGVEAAVSRWASVSSHGRPPVREEPGDRPVRGQRVRTAPAGPRACPTAAHPARRRRRHVLGGAAGDGLLRRDDPTRWRQDRGVQRSDRPKRTSPRC